MNERMERKYGIASGRDNQSGSQEIFRIIYIKINILELFNSGLL